MIIIITCMFCLSSLAAYDLVITTYNIVGIEGESCQGEDPVINPLNYTIIYVYSYTYIIMIHVHVHVNSNGCSCCRSNRALAHPPNQKRRSEPPPLPLCSRFTGGESFWMRLTSSGTTGQRSLLELANWRVVRE